MANFKVVKTFRDRESDLKVFESGSSYISDNKKWTDYLIEEGYLKSKDKPATVKKESVEKENVESKPTTRKKSPTRKKSGD